MTRSPDGLIECDHPGCRALVSLGRSRRWRRDEHGDWCPRHIPATLFDHLEEISDAEADTDAASA